MLWSFRRRRRLDLLLDAIFIVWFAYIMVSGSILPPQVVSLLRNDAPAAVSIEPAHLPEAPELSPDTLPEIYSPGSGLSHSL